jgi:hypothetical protein
LLRRAAPVLVNGSPGIVIAAPGRLFRVLGFELAAGKITRIDAIADRERLCKLDIAVC